MSYQRLGDVAVSPETADLVLARIDQRTAAIQQFAKDEATRRKWTVLLSIAGAVFAAVKLGIVAIPHFRRSRVGELAAQNPARRRRRRR